MYGPLQCEGKVRHLVAPRLVDLSHLLGGLTAVSRNHPKTTFFDSSGTIYACAAPAVEGKPERFLRLVNSRAAYWSNEKYCIK